MNVALIASLSSAAFLPRVAFAQVSADHGLPDGWIGELTSSLALVGAFRDLGGSNPSVLAYVRQWGSGAETESVLCVNNLSRFPQPIELQLQHWAGFTPIELTGQVPFPRIGQLPYLLTLPGHGFYWFTLAAPQVLS